MYFFHCVNSQAIFKYCSQKYFFYGNIYSMLLVNISRGKNAVKVGKCIALFLTISSYPPQLETGLNVWKSRAANIKVKSMN